MIKTKSRSCAGVNSKKHPQNIRAGYDYNPAFQSLQCLILGLTDLTSQPLQRYFLNICFSSFTTVARFVTDCKSIF